MKVAPSLPLVCAGFLLAAVLPALADTVTLKSGEVINGKIISETDQEIVVDVAISSGISDQKTIAKSDVQTAIKTTPDEIAYQAIKGYKIDTRSLPAASYVAIIKSLESFVATYPQSSHIAEVKATLEAFNKEQAQVRAGDIKWNNRWYNKDEVEKNKYDLASQQLLATMKEQASRRDFIGALNTFNTIEQNYPGSQTFPDAVELALTTIRIASTDLERMQTAAKNQEAQFNSGVQLAGEPQKTQMLEARKAQIAAANAALTAAERSQVKWKPLLPLAPKSFEALKTTINTEKPRIEKLEVDDMRSSISASQAAEASLKAKNLDAAEAKIAEAKKLWAQNQQATVLSAELVALKAEAKAKPSPTPTPKATPTPAASPATAATPTPTPKPKGWFGF